VLVVPVLLANERPPLQGESRIEDSAEDSVGGGVEGDWEAEEPVDGPRSADLREMCAGGAGPPLFMDWGRRVPPLEETKPVTEVSECQLRERQEREE